LKSQNKVNDNLAKDALIDVTVSASLDLTDKRIKAVKSALVERDFPKFMEKKLQSTLIFLLNLRSQLLYGYIRSRSDTVNPFSLRD